MIPLNKEHYEASVSSVEAETKRDILKDDLPKYKAIIKARQILQKAEVPYILIPIVRNKKGQHTSISIADLPVKFDEQEKMESHFCPFFLLGAAYTSCFTIGSKMYSKIMSDHGEPVPDDADDYHAAVHALGSYCVGQYLKTSAE